MFLSHHGRTLLLRRSNEVGSYRGRWAGISGFLEPNENPLSCALKEISEEVGLSTSSVFLVKTARPFPVFDKDINTLWVVHPFLFSADKPEIRLDWEHDTFRWIRRHDLSRFETVPKLEEALDRVMEDMSVFEALHPAVLEKFTEIREDRVHGASHLSRQSLEVMRQLADLTSATTSEDLLAELKVLGRQLMDSHPSMAPLTNLVGRLLHTVAENAHLISAVSELKHIVADTCVQLVEESETAVHKIATNAAQLVEDDVTIFTHSRSATVAETFSEIARMGKRIRVIATESRPLLEGTVFAQELSALDFPVTLAVDSAVGHLMDLADLCIVGADSILADGSVVNKIGTFPLAMSALEYDKPFYVICERSKFNLRSIFEPQSEIEEKDTSEVLPYGFQTLLTVRNPYFDRTPNKFVSKLITEEGALPHEELPSIFLKMLEETYL